MRRVLVISVALIVLGVAIRAQQNPTGALAFLQRERTASIPTGNTPLMSEADARRLRIFDLLAQSELHRRGYPPLPPTVRRSFMATLCETGSHWLLTRARHRLQGIRERTRRSNGSDHTREGAHAPPPISSARST